VRQGPLAGVRILEFSGIGPGPFCGMLLADLGADVVRIDRPFERGGPAQVTRRGRRSVPLDLKRPASAALCLRLMERADAVIEGYRPGVMERLGLGPEAALARNPRLVYGRMTGWGQDGPLAQAAGHDINYIALTGALHAIGPADAPVPPLNLVGDFGGGSLYLAMGLLAGVLHARATGEGQVVDAAMTDGAASLLSMTYGLLADGQWQDRRAANLIDGGAPFYGVYRCADGRFVAVGAIEPQFYALLLDTLGMDARAETQMDVATWPEMRRRFAETFAQRTQAEWCAMLEGTDACFAPVASLTEAAEHPHNGARNTFVTVDGVLQPAPAPRFSRTPGAIQRFEPAAGAPDETALRDWGVPESEITNLRDSGAFRAPAA